LQPSEAGPQLKPNFAHVVGVQAAAVHAPATQLLPAGHALPQAPQLLTSLEMLTLQPVGEPKFPVQFAQPALQEDIRHVSAQMAVAF
jgi:hypothetical protein